MTSRHEVLGLQLLSAARSEAHAEVRQALEPRSRHAHLLRTVLRRELEARMHVLGCRAGAVELATGGDCRAAVHAPLDPDLVHPSLLPVGEQADAVARGG